MLINLNTLPGLRPSGVSGGFADFPRMPEFPDAPGLEGLEPPGGSPEATAQAGDHFAHILSEAIDAVNLQDRRADELVVGAATGADVDPHTLMIEAAKAETLVHLTSSISTKMAQNVQTIMNMQI